jgi:predicted amidohydrolase
LNDLTIATAQFPVSKNINKNLNYIKKLTHQAKKEKADLIHFSETCLGGYAGIEFSNWDTYDWKLQRLAEVEILQLAKKLNIGIMYGSNHWISINDIRNSLKYVSREGELVARYDKRFCTERDLLYYKSGREFSSFEINGFKCGLLICFDSRFPELYREYRKLNIQLIFQSFYNARTDGRNIHTVITSPTLQTRAATNYFYISASNSSGYYQSWASIFVLPDGAIKSSCRQHRTGLITNTISKKDTYYDASKSYRTRSISGVLYSE